MLAAQAAGPKLCIAFTVKENSPLLGPDAGGLDESSDGAASQLLQGPCHEFAHKYIMQILWMQANQQVRGC